MKDTNIARYASFQTNQTYVFILLLIITMVAFALRFYKLGEWSFWGDEMFTLRDAGAIFELDISYRKISRIVTHFIITGLGTSEWSARLFPALVGVASIPILFFPMKKVFGVGVALIAVLFLAIAPWHLYWSQNARFYIPMLLFFTLALLTFYLAVEEDRLGYLLLSLFLAGLATQEHLTALLFGPIVISYLVLLIVLPFDKPPGLRPRTFVALILPGTALGFLFVLPFLQDSTLLRTSHRYVNNSPLWIVAGVVYYVGIPTVCMAAIGALYGFTRKNRIAVLLALGAIVPLLAITIVSLVGFSANRYVFVSLTSWIILAAIAAQALFSQRNRRSILFAIGVLSILILTPLSENFLYYRYQNGNRENWKGAVAVIREHKQEQDLVVVPQRLVAEHYLQDKTINMRNVNLTGIEIDMRRTWFIEDMTTAEKFPDVIRWIRANTQLVANLDVHFRARNFKMRVYLYDPDKADYNVALNPDSP